ncbi:MAG TPA: helix-turn-helix domain-containing protein [Mycobacterium sp.]|nr:helix-turn-helix domain-containing protein [Mycobacterium sp.]
MLGLLGDEWTLLVIQQALMGAARYGDFQARLPISHAVLSNRLRSLADAGLLERRVYQTKPPRSEYLTTPRSRSLWPMLVSIWAWEQAWVPDHRGPLPRMHHTVCDEDFAAQVVCGSCGEAGSDKDVVAQWGPSGSWERSIPAAVTRRRSTSSQAGLFPQTMTVLGNRWGFAILVAAFVGVSRFSDFQTQLSAPPGSVADRLAIFVANGVLVAAGNRYRLTEKGRDLFPVLISALQWAQRWYPAPEGPAVELTHATCVRRFSAVMVCDQCTRPLRGTAIAAV